MAMRKIAFILIAMLLLAESCWAVPVTSPFGWRVHPITGQYKFHSGVDLGYAYGDDVLAMMSGKVVYCYWWGGYGNCVILAHPNGDHTLYGHMARIDVGYGQDVVRGQSLGKVGSTGMSTGPHLHLEWWHNGSYMDPMAFFNANEVQNIEFLKAADPMSVLVNQPTAKEPALPASQGDLNVQESQKEQAIRQLNEVFELREKERSESVFFD